MKKFVDIEVLKQFRADVIAGRVECSSETDMLDQCPAANVIEVVPLEEAEEFAETGVIGKWQGVEVAEVRHGEWIKAPYSEKDGNANCSACGHWDWDDCKYCSECGAKMDTYNI